MTKEEVIRWLREYSSETISQDDRDKLLTWYSTASFAEANKTFEFIDIPDMKRETIDRIERELNLIDAEEAQPQGKGRRYLLLTACAAAACLLLVAGFYLFRQSSLKLPPPQAQQANIPPGHDQAILTLAGGQQIVLDSAVIGEISKQGQTSVINQKGQIAYHPVTGSTEVLYNTITTSRANQYQLVLPDGSHVWLNAASSLRYPTAFAGKNRDVELRGEGYFEVAKNARQPFIVHFNNTEVQVLGTAFDVMAYDDEPGGTQTTLISGSVAVRNGLDKIVLEPGKMAVVNDSLSERDANISQVIAWKNGEIALNNADLGNIMRQISRWYDVTVTFKGVVPERRFGGVVKRSVNLGTLLEFFNENGIRSSVHNREIQLSQ